MNIFKVFFKLSLYTFLVFFITAVSASDEAPKDLYDIPKNYRVSNFEVKRIEEKDSKEIHYDYNKDKKADRIVQYKDNKMTLEKIDTNYDGVFDREVRYLSKGDIFKEDYTDQNNDGKFESLKRYRNKLPYMIIDLYRIEDNKEVFISSRRLKKNQERCPSEFLVSKKRKRGNRRSSKIDFNQFINQTPVLMQDLFDISLNMTDYWAYTDIGFKIDHGCLDKWGEFLFPYLVVESVQEGMQCLADLDADHKRSNNNHSQAAYNLFKIQELLKENQVSLFCSEPDLEQNDQGYDWFGSYAHASIEPGGTSFGGRLRHPFISFNPINPKNPSNKGGSPTDAEENDLKATVFHELLHNIGFAHGDSYEFSYACEDCCFLNGSKDYPEELRSVACKICTGNYQKPHSEAYMKDLILYSEIKYQKGEPLTYIATEKMLEAPKNLEYLNYLVKLMGHDENYPLGIFLAQKIQQNHLGQLSEEQKKIIQDIVIIASEDHLNRVLAKYPEKREMITEFKDNFPSAKAVSDAYYELYFNHNLEKALSVIDKNKMALRQIVGNPNSWGKKAIRSGLDDMFYDLVHSQKWSQYTEGYQKKRAAKELSNNYFGFNN